MRRAAITDMRVNRFDGKWKENVGGGDFLNYFDEGGAFVYQKSLDPLILSSGPCLSNASYEGITVDDAIKTKIHTSGGRTDDFVRVFFHIRYDVLKAIEFSRCVQSWTYCSISSHESTDPKTHFGL